MAQAVFVLIQIVPGNLSLCFRLAFGPLCCRSCFAAFFLVMVFGLCQLLLFLCRPGQLPAFVALAILAVVLGAPVRFVVPVLLGGLSGHY